ncbi:16S rRNA (cytosine(1402)-N(4))-methyltransferase RsmH [Candidatus Xianfuyuplasma coldseepsis]|uniref:Ribosomal RNA small subunit methyltransferase H n=1 Tax=Candidatus Xianfuyuplasma coldseepsis TaxID=2782163 RepID=A0A7L7KTL8_9MOLU|nr:16S rRNA (cytosine(1402)-N(4))-methyltransferase RsmH [Xianfuyuplasma coldseepsis]QMS85596.1 16S rRNA (cytosine(1402)-N(4))-methyltransferase RsmH [Xianfuyuplasma coldseepsis]
MVEHISVLLQESLTYLNIKEDGIYVDCTLGGGGHSSAILSQLTTGHLYAFDQDQYAIDRATEKLQNISPNFTIIKSNFRHLASELEKLGVTAVDGILYDLGVSSFQFDLPDRGFSYNYDAPLDMRMNQQQNLTAETIVNTYDFHELMKILYRYADESYAKQIARQIEKDRQVQPIKTTFELVDVIKRALPQKRLNKKGHPAKKTFQALRIAVNDELRVFEESLEQAFPLLNVDGRIVVISFHSLEDRIAKTMFREQTTINIPKHIPITPDLEPDFELLHRKVILPSQMELEQNNRAHSAKLRAIKRVKK